MKALSEREKEAMHKAKLAEEARVKAIEERDEIKSKLVELETSQHQTAVVLQGEIDCLKLKVHARGPFLCAHVYRNLVHVKVCGMYLCTCQTE